MGLDNPLHIAFLLIVLLLVFGARRLPEIGRSVGAGMREFKDSISGQGTPTLNQSVQQPQAPPQPVAAAQAPVVQPAPVAAPPAQAPAEQAREAHLPDVGL
jgi:sec-independent protein translocase protein TatA